MLNVIAVISIIMKKKCILILSSFFLLIDRIYSNDSRCIQHISCVSCNWDKNCNWVKDQCNYIEEEKADSIWLDELNQCTDSDMVVKQDSKYCGEIKHNQFPVKIRYMNNIKSNRKELHNDETIYKTLFCQWSWTNLKSDRLIHLNINNDVNKTNSHLSLALTFTSGLKRVFNLDSYFQVSFKYKDIKSISLLFLSYNSLISSHNNKTYYNRYNESFSLEGKYSPKSMKNVFYSIFFAATCFLLIAVFFIVCFYVRKIKNKKKENTINSNRDNNNIISLRYTDNNEAIKLGENRKKMEELLVIAHYKNESNGTIDKCSVCCEIIIKGNEIVVLPCKHIFHYKCIYKWVMQKIAQPTCPNCNYLLINEKNEINNNKKKNLELEVINTSQGNINYINVISNRIPNI